MSCVTFSSQNHLQMTGRELPVNYSCVGSVFFKWCFPLQSQIRPRGISQSHWFVSCRNGHIDYSVCSHQDYIQEKIWHICNIEVRNRAFGKHTLICPHLPQKLYWEDAERDCPIVKDAINTGRTSDIITSSPSVLFYSVLFCSALLCFVLFCPALLCSALFSSVLLCDEYLICSSTSLAFLLCSCDRSLYHLQLSLIISIHIFSGCPLDSYPFTLATVMCNIRCLPGF